MGKFNGILEILGFIGGLISLATAVVKKHKSAIQVSGILLMLVGLIVAIGHLVQDPKIYKIPADNIGMALLTALCFFLTGLCLFILSTEVEFKKTKKESHGRGH